MNPPLLLAIDTTSACGSIALLAGDTLLEELPLYAPEGFSQSLFDHLAALLARHALRLEEIDLLTALCGPGSFTGVRVGLSAVKGLAAVRGLPAFGVSNLQAIASFGTAARRAVFLDARREEIFGAVYDPNHQLVQPERVLPFAAWLDSLPADVELLTADFRPYLPALTSHRLGAAPRTVAPRALAAAAGRIAWRRFLAGETAPPEALDANYVRRADAELKWRDR